MPLSPQSSFDELASHVIEMKVTPSGNYWTIGGKEISKDVIETLREEAKYIERSLLWEILNATITNEAASLALHKSTEWSHIEYAKALNNWAQFFRRKIHELTR